MGKAVYVVYSAPSSPDQEAAYNEWYDRTHLGQVCEVPGVTGARRYHLQKDSAPLAVDGLPLYLALYDIDSDDPAECVAEIGRRAASGVIEMTSAIQLDPPPVTALYVAV